MRDYHPHNLAAARKRCGPLLEQLLSLEREFVASCNICGGERATVLANRDRYGFPARTAMCLDCGLVYVVDRFTADSYAQFYNDGYYRSLVAAFKGKEQSIARLQSGQRHRSAELLQSLEGYLPSGEGRRMLDVGGSTGVIAQAFSRRFGYHATVIDPALAEVKASLAEGVDAVAATIEDWQTNERFDFILLYRTVEHLYDLCGSLGKIRRLLKSDGYFYCDIADFVQTCRMFGPPQATTKIDHAYWLSREVALPIFRSVGFELVAMNDALPPDQTGFLLRAADPQPLEKMSNSWIARTTRVLREIDLAWMVAKGEIQGPVDWLRRKAYLVKKRVKMRRGA